MIAYEDLDLRIRADGDGFMVSAFSTWSGSQSVEAPFEIDRSLSWDIWRHLEYGPKEARALGTILFNTLLPSPVRALYEQAKGAAYREPYKGVRIRICLDPRNLRLRWLLNLPWEILFDEDDGPGNHPGLNPRMPIVRVLDSTAMTLLAPFEEPVRVLIVIADPRLPITLDFEGELANVEKALESAGIKADVLRQTTRKALGGRIRDGYFNVVHFLGHGEFDGSQEGVLLLEKKDRSPDPLSASEFAAMFVGKSMPRLIVLNACKTAEAGGIGSVGPYAGVAAALVGDGLPSILAMQASIRDRSAILFAERLYERLVNGEAIVSAVTEVRKTLRNQLPNSLDWALPVLFERGSAKNGVLRVLGSHVLSEVGTTHPFPEGKSLWRRRSWRAETKLIPRPGIYRLGEVVRGTLVDNPDLLLAELAERANLNLSTLRGLVDQFEALEIDFDQAEGLLELIHAPTELAVALSGSRLDFNPGSIPLGASAAVINLISTFYYNAQGNREDLADELLIVTPRLSQSLSPLEFQKKIFLEKKGSGSKILQEVYWKRSSKVQNRLLGIGRSLKARVLFVRELTEEFFCTVAYQIRLPWYQRLIKLMQSRRLEIRWLSIPRDISSDDAKTLSMAIALASDIREGSGIVISDQPSESEMFINSKKVLDWRSPEFNTHRLVFEGLWESVAGQVLVSPSATTWVNVRNLAELFLPEADRFGHLEH